LRHHNPTQRRINWFGSLWANLSLGGTVEGTVVHAPGGQGTWIRNPTPQVFVNPGHVGEPWAAACRAEQSLALLIPGRERGAVQMLNFSQFVMGAMYSGMETGPEGEDEIEFALALNQAEETVKRLIDALAK
jgi:hypothetical protein